MGWGGGNSSFPRARSHVQPERRGAEWVLGERTGTPCSAFRDFPNFPPRPSRGRPREVPTGGRASMVLRSPKLPEIREEEEGVEVEEHPGAGKWALPPGSRGAGRRRKAGPRLRVWGWEGGMHGEERCPSAVLAVKPIPQDCGLFTVTAYFLCKSGSPCLVTCSPPLVLQPDEGAGHVAFK